MSKLTRVWATRPVRQNEGWCRALEGEGFDALKVSLMSIEPVGEPDHVSAVKRMILDFDENQKIIFVSQNSVRETFCWLHDYWPQLPMGIEYFAVGKKTADLVMKEGLDVVACSSAMNTDELLAMEALGDVKDQKVLICRGIGGLPRLGQVLEQRGAIVRYCELYARSLPGEAISDAALHLPLNMNDAVVLFSGESLHNFMAVLDANACMHRGMQLVVPGERVLALAQSMGFTQVAMATNASTEEMLQALVSLR